MQIMPRDWSRVSRCLALAVVLSLGIVLSYPLRHCCAQESRQEHISIISLIANPDRYDGKKVLIRGFVVIEFEGDAIYLSETDYRQMLSKNAIAIDTGTRLADLKKMSGRYITLEGVFNASNLGHLGLFSGTIINITRIIDFESGR